MKLIVKDFTAFADAGKRPHNEDFVYPSSLSNSVTPNLYIVCDGIGGAGKGDKAAQISADYIAKYIAEKPSQGPITASYINQVLKYVENGFDDYIRQHPDCWGMGATISVLYFDEYGANIAWAGNCRVYQFRNGNILYKSLDHTEAAQLLRDGKITEMEALTHIRRFPLRAIQGSSYPTQMEFYFIPKAEIQAGDIFYLCSDGVQEAVNDSEIATIFTHGTNTTAMGNEIQALCKISSGDNYASCIVRVEDADSVQVANTDNATLEAAIIPSAEPSFSVESEPIVETPAELVAEASPTIDMSPTVDLTVDVPDSEHIPANDVALPSIEQPEITHSEEEMSTSFSMELPSVEAPSIEPIRVETPVTPPIPVVETPRVEVSPVVTPPRTLIVDDSANTNTSANAGSRPTVSPPPPVETRDSNSTLPWVLIAATFLIVAIFGLIWKLYYTSNGQSYEQYYDLANTYAQKQSYDSSLVYLDLAIKSSGDNAEKISKAQILRNDIVQLKRQNDKTKVLAEAAQYAAMGKYTDYLQAMKRYDDVIKNYGDNGGFIQKKIDSLTLKMNKIDKNKAYSDLVAGVSQMCTDGNGLEAEIYLSEARKLGVSSEKLKELNELSTKCAAMAQNTTGGTNAVADNSTRDIASDAGNTTATTPSTNPSTNSGKSAVSGTTTNPKNSSQVVDPTLNKNARVNANVPNNWEKLPPLEKAKTAFKAKKYDNVLKYFETAKAQNQWDAEAAYMLAYLYQTGLAKEKNPAKALENAKYSAAKQNASGLYLYSKMILNNKNHKDSLIALGNLAQASSQGQKDATALLNQLESKKKKK